MSVRFLSCIESFRFIIALMFCILAPLGAQQLSGRATLCD